VRTLTLTTRRVQHLITPSPTRKHQQGRVRVCECWCGTIVYGVTENGHLPASIDDGLDPSLTTREWLEQVINSTIQRRIQGIRINQILLNKTRPGHVAYVVSIPSSLHAPHMASDHRFYKRFNFQSVAMEEHEVRDTARREAERSQREQQEREQTPFLSLEGTGSSGAPGGISLNANVHVDGTGVAINAGFNLFLVDDQGQHQRDYDRNSISPRPRHHATWPVMPS